MEYNKVIKPKVIIWCNVQSGVVFRTHIDSKFRGNRAIFHNGLLSSWVYYLNSPEMKSRSFDAAVPIRIIRGPGMFVIKIFLEFNNLVETLGKFIIF